MNRSLGSLALAAALLAAGCASPTADGGPEGPLLVIAGPSGTRTERMDPARILEARIEGDLLQLQVQYGGGCREHDFSLLHSGGFMESNPVQTRVTLAHDAHGDPCRALVGAQLRFDLTPLKQAFQRDYRQRSGIIVVHLHPPGGTTGAAATVRYTF